MMMMMAPKVCMYIPKIEMKVKMTEGGYQGRMGNSGGLFSNKRVPQGQQTTSNNKHNNPPVVEMTKSVPPVLHHPGTLLSCRLCSICPMFRHSKAFTRTCLSLVPWCPKTCSKHVNILLMLGLAIVQYREKPANLTSSSSFSAGQFQQLKPLAPTCPLLCLV